MDIAFNQFKPTDEELNDVFKKCVSYIGTVVEEYEDEGLFYLIQKSDEKYLVLFYNRAPTFFEINGDNISEWAESQTIDFLLYFHTAHPGKQICSFDYHQFSNDDMSNWICGLWWHVSDYIDSSLSEEDRNMQYRECMQSLMFVLYGYDFEANVSHDSEYYSPNELCKSTPREDYSGVSHYEL